MSLPSGQQKVAAQCQNCKAIFASEIKTDGTIRPIGIKCGCSCGNGTFRALK